jgi:hypothetical protein
MMKPMTRYSNPEKIVSIYKPELPEFGIAHPYGLTAHEASVEIIRLRAAVRAYDAACIGYQKIIEAQNQIIARLESGLQQR